MRRSRQSAFANPVLVGAVTVLAVLVAVFLAYNANQGLPFVPTYDVNVTVPDAGGLGSAGWPVRRPGLGALALVVRAVRALRCAIGRARQR